MIRSLIANIFGQASTFCASLVTGFAGMIASAPVVVGGTHEAQGVTGMIVSGTAVALAVLGLCTNYFEKRKAAEVSGNAELIKTQASIIHALRAQVASEQEDKVRSVASERKAREASEDFLRRQIDEAHIDVSETRARSHKNLNEAQTRIFELEEEVATLRTLCVTHNIPLPVFQNRSKKPPEFPEELKKSTQAIAIPK